MRLLSQADVICGLAANGSDGYDLAQDGEKRVSSPMKPHADTKATVAFKHPAVVFCRPPNRLS